MATRLSVSAEGLSNLYKRLGLQPKAFTREVRRVIDANVHYRTSVLRRSPALLHKDKRDYQIGNLIMFDGYGPNQGKSIIEAIEAHAAGA